MSRLPLSAAAAAAIVYSVAACVLAALLWSAGLPLSNDGPQHVFAAFVHAHYGDARFGFADAYTLNTPITAHGFAQLFGLLLEPLGWKDAWRTSVVVLAEAWALAFFLLQRRLGTDHPSVAALGPALALQTPLWLGLYPFYSGTAFVMLALALWCGDVPSRRRAGGVAVALTLAALCHTFAALLGGLVLGAVTLARGQTRRAVLQEMALLLVASLPTLAIAAWVKTASAPYLSGDLGDYGDALGRIVLVFDAFTGMAPARPALLLLLAVVAWAQVAQQNRRGELRRDHLGVGAVGLLFVLLSMSLPRDIGGWQFAGTRLLPLAAVCTLALLDPARAQGKAAARLVAGAALAFALLTAGQVARFHSQMRPFADALAASVDGLTPSPHTFLMLDTQPFGPGVTQAPVRDYAPLLHVGQLAALGLGGRPVFSQDLDPAIHAILARTPADPMIDRFQSERLIGKTGAERTRAIYAMAARASYAERVVACVDPQDEPVLTAAGFVVEQRAGALLVLRFEGCVGRAEVTGAVGEHEVSVGWWPSKFPAPTFALNSDGSTQSMQLPALGCGEVWLHVDGVTCAHEVMPGTVVSTFTRTGDNALKCDAAPHP